MFCRYLFQLLPLEVPQKEFNEWDGLISRFIWNSRRPRVRFKSLQLKKTYRYSLQDYYYVAQLKPLICWCTPSYESKWKTMEISQLRIPIQTILGNKNQAERNYFRLNQWTLFTVQLWFKILRKLRLEKQAGVLSWVAYDPDFESARLDGRFKVWAIRGITSFCSVTSNGQFKSYQEISETFGLV